MSVISAQLNKALGPFLLLLMCLLGVFPLDVILPSFPAIASSFQVEINSVAYSVSIFAIGVGISQIIIGPLSDAVGRKRLLLSGLLVATLGAVGCVLSSSFEVFISFRLIQALGCGCFVLSHALVQDLYSEQRRNSMRILLTSASGVFISLSPLAGSILQEHFNWQGSFIVFAMLSICCGLITMKSLKERPTSLKPEGFLSNQRALVKDSVFFKFTAFSCLAFACHFSFIVSAPLLFMDRLGLSASTFGLIFTGYGFSYVLGGVVAHWLNERISPRKQIGVGFTLIGVSGLCLCIWGFVAELSVATILLPMIVCTMGVTIIRPSATTRALGRHPHCAGAAASLNNTLLFTSGGTASALIAATDSLLTLPVLFILSGLLGWVLITLLPRSDSEVR
ncbi:multidrug effflux MFS transporter [Pseudomonas putida]|uniref:multidrug effflux MFS transporter n=1 Tax=Pseudomonas putida TaxID=303 RepID=UPI00383A8227